MLKDTAVQCVQLTNRSHEKWPIERCDIRHMCPYCIYIRIML